MVHNRHPIIHLTQLGKTQASLASLTHLVMARGAS
jgi:hypothetical protein